MVLGGGAGDDVVREACLRQDAGHPRAHWLAAVRAVARGHPHPAPERGQRMAVDEVAHVFGAAGEVRERPAAAGARVRRGKLPGLGRRPLGRLPSVARVAGRRASLAAPDLRLVHPGQGRLDRPPGGGRREAEGPFLRRAFLTRELRLEPPDLFPEPRVLRQKVEILPAEAVPGLAPGDRHGSVS
jgi:hypothetical protein